MAFTQTIDGCFTDRIGDGGVSAAAYESRRAEAIAALKHIEQLADREYVSVLKTPERRSDLEELTAAANRLREGCRDILIVGTGGSSLGARTLCALRTTKTPNLHFMENVDPDGIDPLLESLDASQTGAIFISKSGGTLETIAVTMVTLGWLVERGGNGAARDRTIAITEKTDNPLKRLAALHDIPVLAHDPYIGGRYSVFSSVGLLPAMVCGLDAVAIREGAHELVKQSFAEPEAASAVAGAGVVATLAEERQISISVLMPYRDRLADMALWYRQLWAESLGKDGKGTTPVQANGTVDQHSQLQLYLDGPADKLVNFIHCSTAGAGMAIPPSLATKAGLDHLSGHTIGDILDASSDATAQALMNKGRPVREFQLENMDEFSLAGVLMHFILETLVTAHLWKLEPFGQPAVEAGKLLARAQLDAGKGNAA